MLEKTENIFKLTDTALLGIHNRALCVRIHHSLMLATIRQVILYNSHKNSQLTPVMRSERIVREFIRLFLHVVVIWRKQSKQKCQNIINYLSKYWKLGARGSKAASICVTRMAKKKRNSWKQTNRRIVFSRWCLIVV